MEQGLPNPAAGVPPMLLGHVHCVSTYRYPTLPQLSLDTTVEYLLQAPKVTREVSSMTWTFLDAPADGTVLLVWQPQGPSPQAGARFATDGYVWGDAERLFTQQYKGYNVEMFIHKIGFCPPHEALATHSRRRYRLTPIDGSNSHCDPSLWIVHYCRAEPPDQIPSTRVPFHPQVQQLLHQRKVLQQSGQLVRKEFMLYDKSNWPQLNLPQNFPPTHAQPQSMMSHMGRPQQPYMAGSDPTGPSPAKRQRQSGSMAPRPTSSKMPAVPPGIRDSAMEEEQDDQDLFDLLTPREISSMRLTKHHEWMEEIFSSPWDTLQIDPVPLGQGRRGALASLTEGILDAPTEASIRGGPDFVAKKTGTDKLEELTKRAEEKVASLNAEKEEMVRVHARLIARISRSSNTRAAERGLRAAALSEGKNDDPFKLESGFRNISSASASREVAHGTVEELTKGMEASLGKRVEILHNVGCIEKGGLEEKVAPPSEPEQPAEDTVMGDDPHNDLGGSPNFAEFTTEMDDVASEANTTNHVALRMPQTGAAGTTVSQGPQSTVPAVPTETEKAGVDDWVVVDKESAQSPPPVQTSTGIQPQASTSAASPNTSTLNPAASIDVGADLVDFDATPGDTHADFEGGDFNDQLDFGTLDTAGEALGDFDAGSVDNGVMHEDSAFGDAFHHTEAEVSAGDSGFGPQRGQQGS